MWNMKNVMLFVASLVAVILISISMASADEKTITPQKQNEKAIQLILKSNQDNKKLQQHKK
mgnify:CR=1 FL=1